MRPAEIEGPLGWVRRVLCRRSGGSRPELNAVGMSACMRELYAAMVSWLSRCEEEKYRTLTRLCPPKAAAMSHARRSLRDSGGSAIEDARISLRPPATILSPQSRRTSYRIVKVVHDKQMSVPHMTPVRNSKGTAKYLEWILWQR